MSFVNNGHNINVNITTFLIVKNTQCHYTELNIIYKLMMPQQHFSPGEC